MAKITEELVRKCAEHNECEIFSLEELSLHQRNIAKLEHLDKWCRDLKILYLHNNLISKIENLNRLKKLEYVNFTLNNITRIENLEGCESLKKLDFTVNFIGELTSIENLKGNYNLEELYLTGNPCVDYEGYKEFVIVTLPQLKRLDGEDIKISERIIALQKYNQVRNDILEQQARYMKKNGQPYKVCYFEDECSDDDESHTPETQDKFWKQSTSHTPLTRFEIYKHMERAYPKNENKKVKQKTSKILFTNDGRPLNINEPKLNFELIEDEECNSYKLDLAVYRYMSSSLLEADVQPNYVRVLVKKKIFQLHLPKEVLSDQSSSQRSQTTGHLLITMPKVGDVLKSNMEKKKKDVKIENKSIEKKSKYQTLDVASSLIGSLSKIVTNHSAFVAENGTGTKRIPTNDIPKFFDNPEVPPLI